MNSLQEHQNVSDFECDMVVDAWWTGSGVSETADRLGFFFL